jgi:ABC-type dipeptide/oligopeptide/nickel transport system permease component
VRGWARSVAGRLLQAVASAFAATLIVWALLPLAPGDPAFRVLQSQGIEDPSEHQVDLMRERLGLDRPLPVQYATWLGRVVQGDLSTSFRTGRPVAEEIGSRLPATAALLGTALLASIVISFVLALVAVWFHGRWPDRLIQGYTQVTAAVPTFIFALLVLQYVVVGLGVGSVLPSGTLWAALLPALTIAVDRAGGWTQLLRASLLDHVQAPSVLVARSRGAGRRRALLAHALPNAILPYLTAVGVSVGALVGGAPLIEEIFTWPGVGRLLLQAISARDYPVIQGFVLIGALCYVAAALLVDLLAMAIDPRLREARA